MPKKGTPEYDLWLVKFQAKKSTAVLATPKPTVPTIVTPAALTAIPSFHRFLIQNRGVKLTNQTFENSYHLFNNRPSLFYSNQMGSGVEISNTDFLAGIRIAMQSVTYFRNDERKLPAYAPKPNAIIYWVMLTDENKKVPLAVITQMEDITSKSEAEAILERTFLDEAIDLFCTSVCNNWDIVAIVPYFEKHHPELKPDQIAEHA